MESNIFAPNNQLPFSITFNGNNKEYIKISSDGSFYVNGNLVENDIEIYRAFKNYIYNIVLTSKFSFNDYQTEANGFVFSLKKFKKLYPELPENVYKILALLYDGNGLGEVGEVQGKIKKIVRDNAGIITDEHRYEIQKELGDILFYVASMCHVLDIKMEDAAKGNIEKIKSRIERGTIHGSGDNR